MYNKEAIYKYRETHKDKTDAYYKAYTEQYYIEKKENFKEYYDENKERIKEYYDSNKENKKEYARMNYERTKHIKLMKLKLKREFKNEWNSLCNIGVF